MNTLKSTFITLIATFVITANFSFFTNDWPTDCGSATIDNNYCVSIDTTKPLQEFYKINFAHLNFQTEVDAKKVFGAISNNYLSYKVDFASQNAYLKIHADRTKELKDVIWWNDYLQNKCQSK